MRLFWLVGALLFFHIGYTQYDVPKAPDVQKGVYQYVPLFSNQQQQLLERKLKVYADSTSTQMVVIVIESTNGEDISMLSTKWGQKWGIGQHKKDNGIVMLIAVKDRQVDISTGYGVEHLVPDSEAETIINTIIVPHFKKQQYYVGINKALDILFGLLKGEFKAQKKAEETTRGELISGLLFIIILLFFIFRRGGNLGLFGLLLGMSLGDRSYSSSGFGSGSGDSGFDGGFGGGGFGGGGASGDW